MKLLNFSVGRVQSVVINGEAIQTAHVKQAVPEPWIIDANGAAGDERAVHPDKLYAFARSAYEYWGRQLGRDPARWADGFFGENLTIDNLDEREVRVGDVFALGTKVRLVVSGARTPCVKLAWRLGQPRTFQRKFAASRHTGMYLDVLEAGEVRPGDAWQRIEHDPDMPSIADLCDYVQSARPVPIEPVEKLLAFDKLSPVLRYLLGFKLEAAKRAAGLAAGRWAGWREFRVRTVIEEAPGVRSLVLAPADGRPLCRARAGQFVTVRMAVEGEDVTRTWSLSGYEDEPSSYRLTVRRQGGPGSHGFHQATAGAALQLRAPSGHFVLDTGSFRPAVLIAAGIGITPLMAMLQAHLQRPSPPPVYLLQGARSPDDLVFRRDLERLAAEHPMLQVRFFCSRKTQAGIPLTRITADVVLQALVDLGIELNGQRVALPWYESDLYLCGPDRFCAELATELGARGANPDRIFCESFAATPIVQTQLDTAEVRFEKSKATAIWRADDDLSLMELAESVGLKPAHDCRAGACLTCKTRVTAGSTTADIGDGYALICSGRPRSPRLVLDL